MLVTIAAAAAAVALAPVERPAPTSVTVAKVLLAPNARPTTVCKSEARMQKAAHERAIYRPNPNDRAKRLIEMPMAQGCLLGGAR